MRWRNIFLKLGLLLFFSGFIALLCMSAQYGVPQASTDANVRIDYEHGHSFITKELVEKKVAEYFSDSSKVEAGKLPKLEKYLKEHPHIKNANAFIDSKGKLHINIEQINPIARVLPKGGGSFYIDAERRKIPASGIYTAKVPVLSGYIPEVCNSVAAIESWELKSLVKVIETTLQDEYWSAQIAQAIMSDSGEMKMVPRIGNHIVTLGDSTDLEGKLSRLETYYSEVARNIGWDVYQSLDVQYKNQIVCK